MSVSCKVIEDLLPLYHDGVCSEDSRMLVEEHLSHCKKCSNVKEELEVQPETKEAINGEKQVLKGIKRDLFERITGAIMLGALLMMAAIVTGMGVRNLLWEQRCQTLFEEVILPMQPDEMVVPRDATRYDPSTQMTIAIEGTPEFRTDASYIRYVDGYVLSVCAPFRGDQVVSILSVFPEEKQTRYPWEESVEDVTPEYLSLDILYPAESGEYYGYCIYMRDDEMGVYMNAAVDQYLNLLYTEDMSDTEIGEKLKLIDTYRSEIEHMIAVARKTWTILSE